MRKGVLLGLALASLTAPALSQGTGYIDDRSDPVALVKSLYNAVNRKEYARAWSYFSNPPSDTVEDYAAGYAGTDRVEIRTGLPSEEGAAGSTYYRLPVAIEAHNSDGKTQIFAGCYELRLTNPAIATDAFAPLKIEGGKFKAASGDLDDAVPASCGDGPAGPAVDQLAQRATALYESALDSVCLRMAELSPAERVPESFDIKFRYAYEDGSADERTARLFRFPCNRGAYNESDVFIFSNEYKELRLLSFATPELDIRYVGDDREGAVDSIYVIGFRTELELVNADYDEATRTLHSNAKWRGLGDASSQGAWLFRDGAFSLVRYEVDASYDGEINGQTVIDYMSGP